VIRDDEQHRLAELAGALPQSDADALFDLAVDDARAAASLAGIDDAIMRLSRMADRLERQNQAARAILRGDPTTEID
jgi:hypothetical protein